MNRETYERMFYWWGNLTINGRGALLWAAGYRGDTHTEMSYLVWSDLPPQTRYELTMGRALQVLKED